MIRMLIRFHVLILLFFPDERLDFVCRFSQGRTLSYQISAGSGDPMRLALFAELLLRKPDATSGNVVSPAEPLAAIATTLDLHSDSAAAAGTFETGDSRYALTVGFSKASLAKGTP